jgi:hypothetical protein
MAPSPTAAKAAKAWHWIIIEDSNSGSSDIKNSGLNEKGGTQRAPPIYICFVFAEALLGFRLVAA